MTSDPGVHPQKPGEIAGISMPKSSGLMLNGCSAAMAPAKVARADQAATSNQTFRLIRWATTERAMTTTNQATVWPPMDAQ